MDKRGGAFAYATKDTVRLLSLVYRFSGFVLDKKESAYDESRSSRYRANELSYYFRTKSELRVYNAIKREVLRASKAQSGGKNALQAENFRTENKIRDFIREHGFKIKDKAAFATRLSRLFADKTFLPVVRSEAEYLSHGRAKPALKIWKKDRHIIWLSGVIRNFENRVKERKYNSNQLLSWETLVKKGIPCIIAKKYKPLAKKINEFSTLTNLNLFEYNAAKFIDQEEDSLYRVQHKDEVKSKIKTLQIPGYILTAATASESIFLCKNPQVLDKDMLSFIDAWYFSRFHTMELKKKTLRLKENSTPIFVLHDDLINEKNSSILSLPHVMPC